MIVSVVTFGKLESILRNLPKNFASFFPIFENRAKWIKQRDVESRKGGSISANEGIKACPPRVFQEKRERRVNPVRSNLGSPGVFTSAFNFG